VQLHEKGGRKHAMPCHHAFAEVLRAYIDAAGIGEDRKGFLFRTSPGHNATALTEQPMMQADAWRMIRAARPASLRRVAIIRFERRVPPPISAIEGRLRTMAAHESPRTTKLYDRTDPGRGRANPTVNLPAVSQRYSGITRIEQSTWTRRCFRRQSDISTGGACEINDEPV
jgi:hypothetical protein